VPQRAAGGTDQQIGTSSGASAIQRPSSSCSHSNVKFIADPPLPGSVSMIGIRLTLPLSGRQGAWGAEQ
jgi:hypothetical protein